MMRKYLNIQNIFIFGNKGTAPKSDSFYNIGYSVEVPINPITPQVSSNIKKSFDLVKGIEDEMAPSVGSLAKLYKTYNNLCKEDKTDRGCLEIQNQLGNEYKKVLNVMSDKFPEIRHNVLKTTQELGKSISLKTSRKNIKELYNEIASKKKIPSAKGPLSKRLSSLISNFGVQNSNVSILEISLRTQADLISATELMETLEALISQQRLLIDMGQSFPAVNSEMASIMNGVASIFGFDVSIEGYDIEPVNDINNENFIDDDWRN